MNDDLISRQAAIEKTEMLYRDARDDANYMLIGYNHALSDMRAILKSMPSAQPEIVRCKDCVHKRSVCVRFLRPTQDDFYCAFGERRGGDAE